MKAIKCRDIGNDCFFVARGETDKEVLYKIRTHMNEVHREMVKGMAKRFFESDIEEILRSNINPKPKGYKKKDVQPFDYF